MSTAYPEITIEFSLVFINVKSGLWEFVESNLHNAKYDLPP